MTKNKSWDDDWDWGDEIKDPKKNKKRDIRNKKLSKYRRVEDLLNPNSDY